MRFFVPWGVLLIFYFHHRRHSDSEKQTNRENKLYVYESTLNWKMFHTCFCSAMTIINQMKKIIHIFHSKERQSKKKNEFN